MKFILTILFIFTCFANEPINSQIRNPKNIDFNWKTDLSKHSVELSEIQIVLPKGSFPTLDHPKFLFKDEGLKNFFSKEPVIAVEINGDARAYPLNILTMHEISNDVVGNKPILVTYCPLCNSGIVYNRTLTVDGSSQIFEFEPSGMLRNSDMVMLDRNTETLWQQLIGTGIAGELDQMELEIIPSLILSVEEFFVRYPMGKILSKETGFADSAKHYGTNPYENYDNPEAKPYERFFDHDKIDKRLPPMERVIDIENMGDYKIYPTAVIEKHKVINDTFKDKNVVLMHQAGTVSVLDKEDIKDSKNIGTTVVYNRKLNDQLFTFSKVKKKFTDDQTGSIWDITGRCIDGELKGSQLVIEPHSNHFAFAWLAFYPDSEIFSESE